MKTNEYWVKMFLFTTGIATLVIAGSQMLLRDRLLGEALAPSFGWALLAAGIFTARRWQLWRRGAACAVCVVKAE